MDYIPLYPFDTDPLRILGRRDPPSVPRPSAAPPETPPPEPEPPEEFGTPPGAPPIALEESADDGGDAPAGAASADSTAGPSSAPNDGPPAEDGEGAPERPLRDIVVEWMNAHWDRVAELARAGEPPARSALPFRQPQSASGTEGAASTGLVATPPVHVRKGDRWTKADMAEFLRQLAATHSVTAAAKAVGKHRRSAYKLRTRLKGQPFDIAWEAAFRHGYDELAHAALELALKGEEVPHYYQGELIGTHRKRNPQLIVNMLKMRNQMGAPMLGRYGAAAEFWSENWERIVHRIETGGVTWDDERRELGEAGLAQLDLPGEDGEVDRIIERNLPDERPAGRGRG